MVAKIKLTLMGFLSGTALLVLVACGSGGEPPMLSKFELTACKHTLEDGSTTQCGYLTVPEDRNEPDNGKKLKLYAAIYKSLSGNSDNPPLFYLIGGPGASTAAAYDVFESTAPSNYFRQNFGSERDLIVIDQRGTNYSAPALYCSQELGPLQSQVYGIDYQDAAEMRIEAFRTCYSRLQAEGVNLSAYDSLENATDIRDMALILGFDTFNLYGASYGTRLAMMTMDHYPERIQSVVLDSILPPEINPFEQATPGIVYAFRTFFDAARDLYPDLESQFYEMMDELEAVPIDVVGSHYDEFGNPTDSIMVNVSGDKLASFLVAELKQTPYDRQLPRKISDMYANMDYRPVADAWVSNIDFFFPSGGPGSGSPSVAMYNSIFSADDAYYTNPAKIEQVIRENVSNPSLATYLRVSYIDMEPGIQGLWPVEPLAYRESDPVDSDIPTLMLVGTLDTATPEIFSRPSVELLSNSFYYAIPAGHATAYLECVTQTIDAFLKNPSTRPAITCAMTYEWD